MASATTTAKSPASRGAFIVLEGLDRSGKTTQVKRLEERFVQAGHKVAVMRFPGQFSCLTVVCARLHSLNTVQLQIGLHPSAK